MKKKITGDFGPVFWVGLVLGWAVIAFGLWTELQNKGADNPIYSFKLGFGINILHDAIIAPVVCVFAFVLSKIIPHPMRRVVTWGLFSSVVVSLIAYPAIKGFGKKSDNTTLLPLNYAHSLEIVLAAIWSIVAIIIIANATNHLRKSRVSK